MDPPCRLAQLMNLGPVTARRLGEVGIRDVEDLEEVGSLEAYRRMKRRFPGETTLVALYALEGALLDVHWAELPPDLREELRAAADAE